MKNFAFSLLAAMFVLAMAGPAPAEVEWQEQMSLKLDEAPVDMAATPDGSRYFVLTDSGRILIYSQAGELEEKIPAPKGADGLEALAGGERLLVRSSKEKTVKILDLAFIQDINVKGAPFKGPADAPVTIVVFDDFQCPYCSRMEPMLNQILSAYRKDVKLVFKNFPLRNHRFARTAALAALAAGEQGKFWELHDLLFENYNQLSDQKIRDLAKGAGLDMARFDKDIKRADFQQSINQDVQDGVAAGVRGTPSVFINGRLLRDRSLGGFKQIIDAELKKAGR